MTKCKYYINLNYILFYILPVGSRDIPSQRNTCAGEVRVTNGAIGL